MRTLIATALSVAALVAGLVAPPGATPARAAVPLGRPDAPPAVFDVGTAVVDITPTTPQYLGGFGQMDEPTADAHDPLQVRAFSVARGDTAVAFAIVDTQGWFAGYQEGPYGITDAREEVAGWLQAHGYPGATAGHVVVSSTHSHAAPTIMGIWGPTDVAYLARVHDATVAAIEQAVATAQPATLWAATANVGAVDGSNVSQTDIYDGWSVDGRAPVLWARDPDDGHTIGVYANVPIHADIVNGAGSRLMSADHIGVERDQLDRVLGGTAVVAMGTLGRQESIVQVGGLDQAALVGRYVTDHLLDALRDARPITDPTLAASEQQVVVPGTNPVLLGLILAHHAAGPVCTPEACAIDRADTPPYLTGTLVGTWVTEVRIGDLLYVTQPGEAFPEVSTAIRDAIDGPGEVRIVGMAQDQLGYYWPPEDAPFTQVVNDSDHLIYNTSVALADENVDTAALLASQLGFSGTPTHPMTGAQDPAARRNPGVQFFAVRDRDDAHRVILDASVNPAYDGAALTGGDTPIAWDYGDGTTGHSGELSTHRFPRPGTYTVTATVTDTQGRTRTWSQQVTVPYVRRAPDDRSTGTTSTSAAFPA